MILGYHYKDILMKLVISNVDQLERKHQMYSYRDCGGPVNSSIPAWGIPWTEESDQLQSMGLQ